MPQKIATLQFPIGGLDKRGSYRAQPPFTTPHARNTVPDGTLEQRERGGSRPGIDKAFYEELGSGASVRMLNKIGIVQNDGFRYVEDTFESDTLGSSWSAPSWLAGGLALILPTDAETALVDSGDEGTGAVRAAIPDIDVAKRYLIQIFILPFGGEHFGEYSIFARMDDSAPDVTADGIQATLRLTGTTGAFEGFIIEYVAGVPTKTLFTSGTIGFVNSGWFEIEITGTTVDVRWQNVALVSIVAGAAAGDRLGIGLQEVVGSGLALIDTFRTQYFDLTGSLVRRDLLIASAGGDIHKEDLLGKLKLISTTPKIATDRQIMSSDRLQKLYIADYSDPRISGSDGVITDGGVTLDAASVADWTALNNPIDVNNDIVILTDVTASVVAGGYKITSVVAGQINLAENVGGNGNCSFRIIRSPKIFDPAADTLVLWQAASGKGTVPTGCPIILTYRDSIVLMGPDDAPNNWFIGRQGDPLDWKFGEPDTDAQRPIAGTSSNAGQIGEAIRAGIAHNDDYLVIGCTNSIWVMRGDPRFGGQIDNLSTEIGVVDKKGMAKGPSGEIVFLSRDGIYLIAPGATVPPQAISREALPLELRDVDPTQTIISVEYDTRYKMFRIFITPIEPRGVDHFMFDWDTKAFFPAKYDSDHEPMITMSYSGMSPRERGVIMGSRDGFLEVHQDHFDTDRGIEIESFITFGPMKLGRNDYFEGMLTEIIGTLGADSGPVDWSVFIGKTHEEAVKNAQSSATPDASGTWSKKGLNFKQRPRRRGASMVIKIENNASRRWAIEKIILTTVPKGKQRLFS